MSNKNYKAKTKHKQEAKQKINLKRKYQNCLNTDKSYKTEWES